MIPDHLRERFADYLAGEMDATNRRLLERLLVESDPTLRDEVRQLRATLMAIDDMAPIRTLNCMVATGGRVSTSARTGMASATMLVAAVAFAVGFGMREWMSRSPQHSAAGLLADAHVVEGFLAAPSESDFARALVALSRKR